MLMIVQFYCLFNNFAEILCPNPARAWMSVSVDCCVLPSRGLHIGIIVIPQEIYWVVCMTVMVKLGQ